VVSAGAKLAEYSPAALIGFIASLSVNLAVINALPFPALDGGQLVYVLFELLLRRPVPRRVQEVLTGLSALVLVALAVTTFVGDVQRLGDPGNDVKVERSATVPGDR
jgi:membrane-associated protease RseP (regulator of RpoE activity)